MTYSTSLLGGWRLAIYYIRIYIYIAMPVDRYFILVWVRPVAVYICAGYIKSKYICNIFKKRIHSIYFVTTEIKKKKKKTDKTATSTHDNQHPFPERIIHYGRQMSGYTLIYNQQVDRRERRNSPRNTNLISQQHFGGVALPASIAACRDHKPTCLVDV